MKPAVWKIAIRLLRKLYKIFPFFENFVLKGKNVQKI